jgi:hypothetical protein
VFGGFFSARFCYNIHDERDQREALKATQAYREQQAALQREKLTAMPQRSAGIN